LQDFHQPSAIATKSDDTDSLAMEVIGGATDVGSLQGLSKEDRESSQKPQEK
jgi:hypothetical protein